MYITLCDAKDHCRVDHDNDDIDLTIKIQAASAMVKNYLKSASAYEPMRDDDDTPILDSNGYPEVMVDSSGYKAVRYEVRAATLILVQKLYDQEYEFNAGYLPDEVVSILYPLRDPALA